MIYKRTENYHKRNEIKFAQYIKLSCEMLNSIIQKQKLTMYIYLPISSLTTEIFLQSNKILQKTIQKGNINGEAYERNSITF